MGVCAGDGAAPMGCLLLRAPRCSPNRGEVVRCGGLGRHSVRARRGGQLAVGARTADRVRCRGRASASQGRRCDRARGVALMRSRGLVRWGWSERVWGWTDADDRSDPVAAVSAHVATTSDDRTRQTWRSHPQPVGQAATSRGRRTAMSRRSVPPTCGTPIRAGRVHPDPPVACRAADGTSGKIGQRPLLLAGGVVSRSVGPGDWPPRRHGRHVADYLPSSCHRPRGGDVPATVSSVVASRCPPTGSAWVVARTRRSDR